MTSQRHICRQKTHYDPKEIRFPLKEIQHYRPLFIRSKEVIHAHTPWKTFDKVQIEKLLQRLDDSPEKLYEIIKHQVELKNQKLKFNKLDSETQSYK